MASGPWSGHVGRAVGAVAEMVEHTTMAVGSEAFASARTGYQYVQTAARIPPGPRGRADKQGDRRQQTKTGKDTAHGKRGYNVSHQQKQG